MVDNEAQNRELVWVEQERSNAQHPDGEPEVN